ncbi:hypothetical protein K443DRAFT_671430 [Laccaria amethystina LaAM-08-1]|uniref:Uncharacterized protein n=1 Tax=Laccaria amethystina LaAM-08-1 TaxID=1095629 RepID=A0A0C9Y6C7_9AGAR|nr:hypothetical protein K443DRAFT_671430 [Laccaria amethystina LaAM-08-1]
MAIPYLWVGLVLSYLLWVLFPSSRYLMAHKLSSVPIARVPGGSGWAVGSGMDTARLCLAFRHIPSLSFRVFVPFIYPVALPLFI